MRIRTPPGRSSGLSPRVRGNRLKRGGLRDPVGPIPACAGEPRRLAALCRIAGAYPRVCEGTVSESRWISRRMGLSPRVRGNRAPRMDDGALWGPIPACAGEPHAGTTARRFTTAYPRVCGGTKPASCRRQWSAGLSPRVRGNQREDQAPLSRPGPIPACAGEPTSRRMPSSTSRAYPRVCGGTWKALQGWLIDAGLSPRVRGNRRRGQCGKHAPGPIPACAGEPGRGR